MHWIVQHCFHYCATWKFVAPEQRIHQPSFGCDVQWQMNNVKWFIVLCIIINIVINFHDLHALQRASTFDVVHRTPNFIRIRMPITCLLQNYREFIIFWCNEADVKGTSKKKETHVWLQQMIGNFLSSLSTYHDALTSLTIDHGNGCEAFSIQCVCAESGM